MKQTLILLAVALLAVVPASAKRKWTEEMKQTLEEMQSMYFWQCWVQCLESHDAANGYVRRVDDYSIPSLKDTRELVAKEYERAKVAKKVIDAICGRKKGSKREAALSNYFKDMERANRIVASVEQINEDAPMLLGVIDHELKHRKPAVMPAGRLLSFSSSASNGFAGWRHELSLERNANGDGGTLNLKETNYRHFEPDGPKPTDITVEVADTVLQRVRDMVENGMLYEIGKNYQPDIMITDATSWSLYMKFEGGSISSSGYASGPDHHETLREIEAYLAGLIPKQDH